MKTLTLFRLIQSLVTLCFTLLIFTDNQIQSIDLDQNNEIRSDLVSFFGDENQVGSALIRHKRTLNILEYLKERRTKRNKYSITLSFEMKAWLNFEVKKREEGTTEKPKKPSKPKDQDYTGHGEQPIEDETGSDDITESTPKPRPIVYNNTEFIELCKDPVFTAVDSSLDGKEILIFKGDKFFVMENLQYGSGNLVVSGQIRELLPQFESKGFTSMVTIIEGPMRAYIFAFYDKPERAGWTPAGYARAKYVNEFKKKSLSTLPKRGFQAVLDNRNITNPLLIGLNGDMVYYYKTDKNTFTKVKEVEHHKSDQKFPNGITAGFSMPNGYVYLFKGKKYCVREMYYEVRKEGVYCDLWLDTKIFLGCYGQYPPPYSMDQDIENYSGLKAQSDDPVINLCSNLNDIKLELFADGLTVMAFQEDKYLEIHNLLVKPDFRAQTLATDKWKGFEANPDAIMIVREGQHLRGSMFAFHKGKYSQWAPDGKPVESNKEIEKFSSIIQNSDILNPMAVAFGESSVYYYSTDSTSLKLNKTVDYTNTDENWPKGITTALTLNTDHIYLFKGDTYCVREWMCADKKANCCKEWLSAKELFHC